MNATDEKFLAYVESVVETAPPLMKCVNAARICDVSLRSVQRWIASGELAVVRVGATGSREVRIPREALRDFLLARCER